jgi:uncharacterized integral membrane protein (TIGR00697 family)
MDRKQHLYLWLAGLFVGALLVADLIGGKIFRFHLFTDVDLSCGMLAFPVTFVLTDVLNEFYGPVATRRVTYLGLGAAVLAFAVINVALAAPVSPESPLSDADFAKVFSFSRRLYIASLTAYVVGQLIDIKAFNFFRGLTRHRLLWLRATGSTLVSQGIDTLVVSFVFYTGLKPTSFILRISWHSYLLKFVIAVALTPVIYFLHALILRVIKVAEVPEPGR